MANRTNTMAQYVQLWTGLGNIYRLKRKNDVIEGLVGAQVLWKYRLLRAMFGRHIGYLVAESLAKRSQARRFGCEMTYSTT